MFIAFSFYTPEKMSISVPIPVSRIKSKYRVISQLISTYGLDLRLGNLALVGIVALTLLVGLGSLLTSISIQATR